MIRNYIGHIRTTVHVKKSAPELRYRFPELLFVLSIFRSPRYISVNRKASFEIRKASSGQAKFRRNCFGISEPQVRNLRTYVRTLILLWSRLFVSDTLRSSYVPGELKRCCRSYVRTWYSRSLLEHYRYGCFIQVRPTTDSPLEAEEVSQF